MKTTKISMLALVAAVLLAGLGSAQRWTPRRMPIPIPARTKGTTWTPPVANYRKVGSIGLSYGPSKARVYASLNGQAGCVSRNLVSGVNTPSRASTAYGSASASAYLFGKSIPIVQLVAYARSERGRMVLRYQYTDRPFGQRTWLRMRLGPFVLYDRSQAQNQQLSKAWSKTIFQAASTFMAGPFPVIVQATVGGGFHVGFGAATTGNEPQAKVFGQAGVFATGSLGGGVGIPGANIQLVVSLKLLDLSVQPTISASPYFGGGYIDALVEPLRMYLRVVAHFWRFSRGWTIFNWSAGRQVIGRGLS